TPLPAAVHVLKACGLYGVLPPRGPTEVEDAVLAEQQRQGERRRAALMAAPWGEMRWKSATRDVIVRYFRVFTEKVRGTSPPCGNDHREGTRRLSAAALWSG